MCFHALSVTVGDILASISSKSPFTRFASAIHRATSRRLYCPSANFSHFRRSLRHSRASCPSAYVPSSPIPPSCAHVSDDCIGKAGYIQQKLDWRRERELLGSQCPAPNRPASSEALLWLMLGLPARVAIIQKTRRRVKCHMRDKPLKSAKPRLILAPSRRQSTSCLG